MLNKTQSRDRWDSVDGPPPERPWWHYFPHLRDEFRAKDCPRQAAALTYMTLFAIVPTLTVVFTMVSLFPAFEDLSDQLRAFLFQNLLPSASLDVEEYLNEFTQQARSLTLAGVMVLMVTAYMMIKNIEATFNDIWGVTEARRGLSNFLLYWAILSLGPLLLGVGLGISTYLLSLKLFAGEYNTLGIIPTLLSFFPWLLSTAAFTLLFAAVPNCRVPFRDAFYGGLLTAVVFELFKELFGWAVGQTSFRAVYGAFAIVPIFLLWIYLLWMIVLAGAVFVRSLSSYKVIHIKATYPDLVAALLALWQFRQSQQTGAAVRDEQLLAVGLVPDQWQQVRDALLAHRVVAVTQEGDYLLCRDLSAVSLRQLAEMVGVESLLPGVSDHLQTFDWFPQVASRLLAVDQHMEAEFDVSIEELFAVEPEPLPLYPEEEESLQEADFDGSAELPTADDLASEGEPELSGLTIADLDEEDDYFASLSGERPTGEPTSDNHSAEQTLTTEDDHVRSK